MLPDNQSIHEVFNTFDFYERASGAKINKGKCKGLGNVDCTRSNWKARIQKINNIIPAWRHRDLSYKGKALVINSLLTTTLWYNATSLPVPSWAIAQIEESMYNLFWDYKRHLVNKDILALPVQHGGFNIPRIKTKNSVSET